MTGSTLTDALLYLFPSGHALLVGLGMVVVGGVMRLRRVRWGAAVARLGLLLAPASAVPLSPWLYVLLIVVFVAWTLGASRSIAIQRASTGALLIVSLAFFATALWSGPSAPRSSPDARPVIVLGDSLSAGVGRTDSGTWPRLLAERTSRQVESFARAGAELRDGLSQAKAIPVGESVVLIELGGNDILGDATVDRFNDSLRDLLQHVSKPGRSLVMFELPLLPLQYRFGRAQRLVCADFGVRLIPRRVLAGAITLPGHTTDGLHLSPAGHLWLAERVAPWL